MKIYTTKVKRLTGTDYTEVYPKAKSIYKSLISNARRLAYVRSAYFNGEKVFLDYFWEHLRTKNSKDRVRRLKQYPCAVDLIKNSKFEPMTIKIGEKQSELLYRFSGINGNNELFFVQIKENTKKKQKYFISVFPKENV